MSLHCAGSVFKADILVTIPDNYKDLPKYHTKKILRHLVELSAQRKAAGLPYLTWVAQPVWFGLLVMDDPEVKDGVNISTQTHPEFHKGMAHDEFAYLVQLYAEHLAKLISDDYLYVNYLGQHTLAIYQIAPDALGRTSA